MKILNFILSSLTPDVLSRFSTAKSTGTCKVCGETATEFRTTIAQIEYQVSAICQDCQDVFWGSDK